MVLQVKKGSTLKVHSHALLEARIANLEEANQAASERKKRKKKRIQKGGTLSQVEAEDIVGERDVEAQLEAERQGLGLPSSSPLTALLNPSSTSILVREDKLI
jgi:hypothetical protein